MPESPDTTPLAEDEAAGGTALLIIDMLSDWRFPDADRLAEGADAIAPRIAALKRRCARAGVPTIYANDNRGRWRSDFREVVETALGGDARSRRIAERLKPTRDDYFVLKPKHSAFHATPLDLLLRHLGAHRLILTGVSTDQCVLYTAVEARMHDYEVIVPGDTSASLSDERHASAVRHMAEVLGATTDPSDTVGVPPCKDGGVR